MENNKLIDFGEDIILDPTEIVAIRTPQNKSKEWHTIELYNGNTFDVHHNVYKNIQNYLKKNQQLKEIENDGI